MSANKKIGVLGASGYTGADAVRLLVRHPHAEIVALTANTHAGKAMGEVFPHFFMLDLPRLVEWEKVDWSGLDAVFCGLPHGTTQEIIAAVLAANPAIKVLDMSADFRLRDMATYAQWYGHDHRAPSLQGEAVYGLTELYRDTIKAAVQAGKKWVSTDQNARVSVDTSKKGEATFNLSHLKPGSTVEIIQDGKSLGK